MKIANAKYPKSFIARVKAIHAHHGLYMVGMFCAACGVKASHAITIIRN